MSIRRIFALALRIIRQFGRDHRTLALLFLAPLLIMTLLNFVLNSSTQSLKLGVVPPDGPLGSALYTAIKARTSGQPDLTVVQVNRSSVDRALKDGTADGVLVFPAQMDPFGNPAGGVSLHLEGSNPPADQQLRTLVSQLVAGLSVGNIPATSTPGAAPPLAVSYLYGGPQYTQTDAMAPLLVGIFAFFFVFLLTSVSFLRERSQGTIERLIVSPLSKTELVLGYVLGFTLFALLQSIIILLYVVYVLRVHYAGNLGLLILVTLALTLGSVNMGIFLSAFARNELQIIQFIPLVIVPQILLGGLFWPVDTLPVGLRQLAYIMPVTYADFALKGIMIKGQTLSTIWPDLAFICGFALLMVLAAATSLRQEHQ